MALRKKGKKPQPELVMTQFTDTYMSPVAPFTNMDK